MDIWELHQYPKFAKAQKTLNFNNYLVIYVTSGTYMNIQSYIKF